MPEAQHSGMLKTTGGKMEAILSIDPGDTESGFVVTDRSDGIDVYKRQILQMIN